MTNTMMLHQGQKLRQILAEKNVNQTDLAKIVGCTRAHITYLIGCESWHSRTVNKIAKGLKVPIATFFEP